MSELTGTSARRRPAPMVGTTNPRSAAGHTCQWCEAPATTVVTVRPAKVHRDLGVIENAITAAACRACADKIEDQPKHIDALRRKHARDVPQLGLFELIGDGPRSAVHG